MKSITRSLYKKAIRPSKMMKTKTLRKTNKNRPVPK